MIFEIKKYFKSNVYFFTILTIIILIYTIYIANSTINVPMMDYWRYINNYVDKCFMGGLTFDELYESFAGHRSLLTTLLFIINVIFFKLNVRVSTFFAIIIMLASSILIYNMFKLNLKSYKLNKKYENFAQIIGAAIIFPIFNLNQWEILLTEFATPFTIRIFITICIFVITDKIIKQKNLQSTILYYSLFLALSINLIFAGYCFAVVGAILAILFIDYILNIKNNVNYKLYSWVLLSIIVSMYLYLHNGGIGKGLKIFIKTLLFNIHKGILVLMGSSVIRHNINTKEGVFVYYFVGLVVMLLYLTSIFIYFKNKFFKNTYLPLFFIFYTLINMLCMYISRFLEFGIVGMTASRYVIDTTVGLIGVIWIFGVYFCYKNNNENKKNVLNYSKLIPVLTLIMFLTVTNLFEKEKMEKHRCVYYRSLVDKMLNIDTISDKDLNQFQANTVEYVRNGVQLMKKYKLGIFNKP